LPFGGLLIINSEELQSAKAKAVEVDNQDEVFRHSPFKIDDTSIIYSLECEVEMVKKLLKMHQGLMCIIIKPILKKVAFITFPQLEKKEESTEESQDSLLCDLFQILYDTLERGQGSLNDVKRLYSITRKPTNPMR
jgi:hypothetical protein